MEEDQRMQEEREAASMKEREEQLRLMEVSQYGRPHFSCDTFKG